MKKNFIYLVMTAFMGLFAACSQEEAPGSPDIQSKRVSISAQLPTDGVKTRALPSADGHQLRCILEIWSKGDNPELMHREEKTETAAVDGKLSFEFTLEQGTYDFLMWADFVESGVGLANGHYTDKFYDTNSLKNITLKDASLLYNTDACDAFFAAEEFVKTEELQAFDATLKRPFAKLVVSEKNKANFALCKKVSVSHKVPQGFNVADGSVSTSEVEAALTDVAPLGAGDTDLKLFSYYVFAATADDALGELKLTFKNDEGTELRSTAIPAGVSVVRNRCTQAKGHLVAEATVNGSLDVDFSEDWESNEEDVDPVDPTPEIKKGDFFYSDGTWSTALDGNKACVGIVFAVGTGNKDNINNYGGKLTDIKGYVMALNNTNKLNLYPEVSALPELGELGTDAIDAYLGYTYTELMKNRADYGTDANFAIVKKVTESYADVSGTSGWYIPSYKQMEDLLASYYEAGSPIAAALTTLGEQATGMEQANESSATAYITSTITSAGKVTRAVLTHATDVTARKEGNPKDTGYARPIFTF